MLEKQSIFERKLAIFENIQEKPQKIETEDKNLRFQQSLKRVQKEFGQKVTYIATKFIQFNSKIWVQLLI